MYGGLEAGPAVIKTAFGNLCIFQGMELRFRQIRSEIDGL